MLNKILRLGPIFFVSFAFALTLSIAFYLTIPYSRQLLPFIAISWSIAALLLFTLPFVIVHSKKLMELETGWEHAFSEIPNEGTWEWNLKTNAITYSKQWKELLGYQESDIGNSPNEWQSRLHPDDYKRIMRQHQSFCSGNADIYEMEMRLKCKDELYRWFHIQGRVIKRDKLGYPLKILGITTDIDQKKRNEFELQKAGLIAEKTSNILLITDTKGYTEWVNPGFTKSSGYSKEEIIGKKPGELLQGPKTDPKTVQYMHDQLAKKEGFSVEIVNYTKLKDPYWLFIQCEPIFDRFGTLTHFIAIETDITQKKLEEAAKSSFVSIVAHELRTPITSIKGALELVEKDKLPKESQHVLQIAKQSCERITLLVNDLLESDKLAHGQFALEKQEVHSKDLVERVVTENLPLAKQQHVELKATSITPCTFQGDPNRLIQILTNFVSNAIKFSPDQGVVEICAQKAEGSIEFSVMDRGPGISTYDQERVFAKFSSVHTKTHRKLPTSGLGLSIAKALVEAHGGTIGCKKREGGGTIFFFRLPL